MDYIKLAKDAKTDSFALATASEELRNAALGKIADALNANSKKIFEANAADLERGAKENLPGPIMGRLRFDEHKLSDCVQGIRDLIVLKDPVSKVLFCRELDEGLILEKITCPIGVIGVIFESRPDALVQISSLCVKSGNAAILKGGSEAAKTNRVLFEIIHDAGCSAGLPEGFLSLVEDRSGIDELLKCHESIDLIIPRGSNSFVQYIMENSKIPVMGHADGICHIYVDEFANLDKAIPIIIDSKTQYVAACNAVETLLIHEQVYDAVTDALRDEAFEMRFDEAGYSLEFLDYILSVKKVSNLQEAIDHINRYGSHHTDVIITESEENADSFMNFVDSAGVYLNCSSRFADGFRYGFGAEVGISTGKLHARGPVGPDGLVIYKYKLRGNGQIVADYASGKSKFHFKDL